MSRKKNFAKKRLLAKNKIVGQIFIAKTKIFAKKNFIRKKELCEKKITHPHKNSPRKKIISGKKNSTTRVLKKKNFVEEKNFAEKKLCQKKCHQKTKQWVLTSKQLNLVEAHNCKNVRTFKKTRISGPYGPLEILAPAGGSLSSPLFYSLCLPLYYF